MILSKHELKQFFFNVYCNAPQESKLEVLSNFIRSKDLDVNDSVYDFLEDDTYENFMKLMGEL